MRWAGERKPSRSEGLHRSSKARGDTLCASTFHEEGIPVSMPAYDYRCQACGNRFEAWQKITDDPIQVCPKCSGHVQRIIHATGLVFKGGGFYSTDHRGAATAASPADEGHAPATDGAKGEAKSEKSEAATPKAETKADAKPAPAAAPAANA